MSRGNDYWKLSPPGSRKGKDFKAALAEAQYHHLQSASKSRLIELYSRAQRGLTSYEACSKETLKTFCARRGLQISKPKSKKGELIQLLEKADDDQTFVRFMDLPPELRVHIYELSFKSFGRLDYPAQPPITQVSRLLREESLPVFYKTCTFMITVPNPNLAGRSGNLSLSSSTRAFLDHTSDENLNTVRRIWLTGPVVDHGRTETASWLLNFKRNAKRRVLSATRDGKFVLSLATNNKIKKRIARIRRAYIKGSQPARELIPRFVKVFEGQHRAR